MRVGFISVVDNACLIEVSAGARNVRRGMQIVVHEARLVKVEYLLQLIAVQDGIAVRVISRVQQRRPVGQYDVLEELVDGGRLMHRVLDQLQLAGLLLRAILRVNRVHLLHDLVDLVVRDPFELARAEPQTQHGRQWQPQYNTQ